MKILIGKIKNYLPKLVFINKIYQHLRVDLCFLRNYGRKKNNNKCISSKSQTCSKLGKNRPSRHFLVKNQDGNTKIIRRCPGVFIVNVEQISIVDFEQVNTAG